MLYPQKGSMAIGSRRVTPTAPVAAAVVSEAMVAPTNTPCCQSRASNTSGATFARRPPKMNAEIGTPSGSSKCFEIEGDCLAATVYRELGCAALPLLGVQRSPFQSVRLAGTAPSIPSHHGVPSLVIATLVKIVS